MTLGISTRTPQQALAALLDRYAPQRLLVVGASSFPALAAFQAAHPEALVAHAAPGPLAQELAAQRFDLALVIDWPCAQILLTHADLADRRRYLNIDNTLRTLLSHGALPIVNENDTVATKELRVGDNDNLAAMVASVVEADALIICSDVDGLYTANPRTDTTAQLIPRVEALTADIYAMAGGSHHSTGTGGMVTKLQAADKATAVGIETLIINGQRAQSFEALLNGEAVGTLFAARQTTLSAKKHWLLHSSKASAEVWLDQGAAQAVQHKGASLLAKGVSQVQGEFDKGDAVWLLAPDGSKIAKGVSQYNAAELNKIKGIHSDQIAAVLGYCPSEVAVHRDDLVVLQGA